MQRNFISLSYVIKEIIDSIMCDRLKSFFPSSLLLER